MSRTKPTAEQVANRMRPCLRWGVVSRRGFLDSVHHTHEVAGYSTVYESDVVIRIEIRPAKRLRPRQGRKGRKAK